MTAIDRLRRDILNEIDNLLAAGQQPLPRRGDQFEQWLKAQRDEYEVESSEQWKALNEVLDTYRLHADTGTPLDQHCCENGNVDDCHGCHQESKR
ncbi:hypothetical protein [Kitasatospora sp. NBC_01302]|uniref:hypothetical protein n=1 Tax=Kitasatospora sp. NBC_01302 TaxID=2903575 RepID=UPI002E15A8C5|nr:hypothetical protein OG294_13955 [Kitasatospora sp. NBC_01302]